LNASKSEEDTFDKTTGKAKEVPKKITHKVVSTLIIKDLKSPLVIVTLRMLLRIMMETQVLLVNLGAITKPFSIIIF